LRHPLGRRTEAHQAGWTRLRLALRHDLSVRLHYLCLPVAFSGLLWFTRDQWFITDDWEFIHRLIPGVGHLGLFAPHNEHWSTLPLLVYKVLFALVGVRTYVPYIAVLLALHVLTAHLLWRLMRTAGADAWVATAFSAVFLVLGAGLENIIWAFQIGFVGALAAGLGMVMVGQRGGRVRLVAAWLLGIASLMCSGIGPFMVAAACLAALLRFGWRRAMATVSVPAAAYSAWLLVIGHSGAAAVPHGTVSGVPDYMFTGITAAASGITGLGPLGAMLLVPFAGWLIVRAWRDRRLASVVALAAGTVAFYFVVGLARVGLGTVEAMSPRYVYVSAVLLLPAAAVATSQLTRGHSRRTLILVAALACAAAANVHSLVVVTEVAAAVRHQAEARMVAAANQMSGTTTNRSGGPEPGAAPDLTWSDLLYLKQMHDLPT
jgi:hypothetical protein